MRHYRTNLPPKTSVLYDETGNDGVGDSNAGNGDPMMRMTRSRNGFVYKLLVAGWKSIGELTLEAAYVPTQLSHWSRLR